MTTVYLTRETHERVVREALEQHRDPHTAVTALLLGVDEKEVTKAERNLGKTANYVLLYDPKFMATCDFNKLRK